jgi:DNA excision repair protein ERCC-4
MSTAGRLIERLEAEKANPRRRFAPPQTGRATLPADLRPDQVTAVCDSREQLPLDLSPLQMVRGTLPTGDYSVVGLERVISIERKSLSDLLGCIGGERERFDREVQRLLAYPCRGVVIESSWEEIEAGDWASKIKPQAAIGSLLGWSERGLPLYMCGDHARAGRFVGRLLFIAARRRYRELRALAGSIGTEAEGTT